MGVFLFLLTFPGHILRGKTDIGFKTYDGCLKKLYPAVMHEAMKTITLRDAAYHSLLVFKNADDSFSDVIDRLISKWAALPVGALRI
jgi:hypothetical protein